MQITKIISSATVERLKQKARKLKREKSIPHTQALDEIAVSAGFNHWHQVVQANDALKPSEVALSSGCVMAFDVKDGMDVDTSDGVLIEDHFLEMLTEKQLFEIYVNSPDEDDEQNRPIKETLSDSELHVDFPLAFTEDLQPGGINYQVCDFTPGGRFETDINRLCPPADTAVIRAA